ncbi:hypothetical protein HMPREF9720_1110 [Alistipes sp. HGB5]|nr:SPFH/Band 7/PHB domain protein [Alistipes sp. HGB5]EFR56914.1 hypothetical protein HMPREF9720_1110 [Alistipes sp. HGB5]
MENGNFVYKGWKCNGFLALTLIFVGLALGVCAIVFGAQRIDAGLAFGVGPVVIGSVWCLCMLICMAGFMLLEPNDARVNYLAYAPEIAAVMLRRQQADAIISAREKIVEGAVSMVHMALERLGNEHIVELDEERKAAMVTNLLVVLCADEAAQPVVNAGTLHH